MKTALIFAGLCLLAATTLHATPTRGISDDERFAGSNDSTYCILRTETDNLGSHYNSQRKVFFEERSKDGMTTVKSTLLLEQNKSIDANHNDPKAPAPVITTLISRDDSISVASILEKFPRQETETWDAGKLGRLEVTQTVGVMLDRNRVLLAEAGSIAKDTFGGRSPSSDFKLVEVTQDRNAIYLKLSKEAGDHLDPETRIVCIGLEKTKQVKAQLDRKEFYLLAGTHDKKEAALAQARQWIDAGQGTMEVWELPAQNAYGIVDGRAMERMKAPGGVDKLAEKLGVELKPISGESLGQWIEVP